MTTPEDYKYKLKLSKTKINNELSRLTDESDRLDRTRISKNRSKEDMQDNIMNEIGVDDFLTGEHLQKKISKWNEWKTNFENTVPNQDGSKTREPFPAFEEKSALDRYLPAAHSGLGADARAEINTDELT